MKKLFAWMLAMVLLLPTPAAGVGAAAAVVIEAESGQLLFSQNPHQRLPMASTTKIMTALLALEQPNLDEEFVVDAEAIRVEGSSMGLQEGDTVTLRALAVGMLTASGNDAANAAAVQISGEIPAFAQLMNQRAQALGLENTRFVTPSGLDDENHYSSAADLALLAREAIANPEFFAICSAQRVETLFGNPPYRRSLYNHNRLLALYPQAVGVKTGFTKKSGRCLVSAAQQDDITLIAVTLNCPDDWNVHRALYQQQFPLVERLTLPEAEPPPRSLLTLPVVGGRESTLFLESEGVFAFSRPRDAPQSITYALFGQQFAYAPIKRGDILGKIVYYIDSKPIGQLPLVAGQDVEALPAPPISGWQLWSQGLWEWLFQMGL